MSRIWKMSLEAKYIWLKNQGIQYLFVIAPDKHSIYSEYMPSRINQIGKQTRLDQFLEYMQDSEVPILDLRKPLLQAKNYGQLYYKNDTHWNFFGAAIAQHEIMQYIHKYYPNLYPTDYRVEDFSWSEITGGDMTAMLNLSDKIKEVAPQLRKPLSLCNQQIIEKNDVPDKSTFSTECHQDAPKALIFRDSFFVFLHPYISQYFAKSLYVWIYPDSKQLEQYVELHHPDIVIEERVERSIKAIPTLPTPQNKAYYIFLEDLFKKGLVVYKLAGHHQNDLTVANQLTLVSLEQSYKLIAQGNDPSFLLPELKKEERVYYIVKIKLKAPQATNWQIFYSTSQLPQYNEKNSVSGQLQSGENTIYAVLDDANLQGQIRVDPGNVMGEYILDSLEIRALKRQ